ncbi:hypothetical protein [Psychrobacter sp. 1044]|uniref:hypothetical protein n=1 Tax=Psychrobacter TaxID=497 RepID=UPI00191AB265|nr:hypothetical protein [Psychrobacter sp. 1044]
MKNLSFVLFSMFVLSSCYNSSTTTSSAKINETEVISKLSVSNFTSVCSHDEVKPMNISNSLTVWGFDPLLSDKERKCDKLNLEEFSTMNCKYDENLIQNPGIHLYKDSEGWFKFVYETSDICINSLKTYAAQSEEF